MDNRRTIGISCAMHLTTSIPDNLSLTYVLCHPTWIIPYEGNTSFDTLPNETLAHIFSYFNPIDLHRFSSVCKDMSALSLYTLEMVLCQVGFSGALPLPLVTESKPLIDRIRKYYPDFHPPPCDYIPHEDDYSEEYDDYTPPDEDSDDDWYDPDYGCDSYDDDDEDDDEDYYT